MQMISTILWTETWKAVERMFLTLFKKRKKKRERPWIMSPPPWYEWKALNVIIDFLHITTCGNQDPLYLQRIRTTAIFSDEGKITSWSLDTTAFSGTCSGCWLLSSSGASFCCSISSSFRRAFLRLVSAPMVGKLGGGGSGGSAALGFLFCIGQFRFPLWHAQSTL